MKLIRIVFVVFASCINAAQSSCMCNFPNCSKFNESMICASDCVFGSERRACNFTSISFKGCGESKRDIPARVTNILSVPELVFDAYLSVVRPSVVNSLIRHGTIRRNAALDKILQSPRRRRVGYASDWGGAAFFLLH